jgi:hypothetical protein
MTKRPKSQRGKLAPKPPRAEMPAPGNTLAEPLNRIARELDVAYAVCVTVEMALKGQNADADEEMALCLHRHVGEPMCRLAEELRFVASGLAGSVRAAPRMLEAKETSGWPDYSEMASLIARDAPA